MSRNQLNIRVSDELEAHIDKKRIELASKLKMIPTRSDVVRYALADYLGISLADTDYDRRTSTEAARVNNKDRRGK
jgi:predicted transcriptional regulator